MNSAVTRGLIIATLVGTLGAWIILRPAFAREAVAPIWYAVTTPVAIPDASSVDSIVNVDGAGSEIYDIRVSLHITHPSVGDLDVSLIGPDGTTVDLTSDNGGPAANYGSGCQPEASRTIFDDGAETVVTAAAAPFVGMFRPEVPLGAFAGKGGSAVNGVWRLRVADDTSGQVGILQCWTLYLTAGVAAPASFDDAYMLSLNAPLTVPPPGVLVNDDTNDGGPMTAALVASPAHGVVMLGTSGGFTYTPAPNYEGPDRFAYRATNNIATGNVAWVDVTVVSTPTTNGDILAVPFETPVVVKAPGVLANDVNPIPGSWMIAEPFGPYSMTELRPDGSFTFPSIPRFIGRIYRTYRAVNASGPGNVAYVFIDVAPPTTVQPPLLVSAFNVSGNSVTLRWWAPEHGPRPTGYVVEGGLRPGEVLASIPTGSADPIFSFVAPTGSFYVRVRALAGEERSQTSNEIALHVNVPVVPSKPLSLLGLVNGSTLHLAWTNSYQGGPPEQMLLDVTGPYSGRFELDSTQSFDFAGVPDGTYTLQVSAANAGGVSPPSRPITLTFPAACSGPPARPGDFLAYRVDRTINAVWFTAGFGPAPTGFVLDVSGDHTGQFPTTGRALSGTVPPGQYGLRVAAFNPCGTGDYTPVQTVIVP